MCTSAAGTPRASPRTRVTVTVPFLMLLFGSIIGLARVTVLPESNMAATGCPSTLTVREGVLGGLDVWRAHI